MFVAAMVTDHHSRQPDDVQLPKVRITEIDPQGDERLRHGGDDGGVWIRHGIQQLAADSVIFFDIDQEQPSLLPGAKDGRVPVAHPGDTMLHHGGHPTTPFQYDVVNSDGWVDVMADSDAWSRFGERYGYNVRDSTAGRWRRQRHTRADRVSYRSRPEGN